MRKFKRWLIERFLPVWAKETILKENESLRELVADLRQQVGALNSYIDGLEAGIKAQRRIIITTGGAQK